MRFPAVLMALALACCLAAPAARGQEDTRLVADEIRLENAQILIAEGNVEIFHKGARLTAARVRYDQRTDQLSITGPIRLTDGGQTTILADSAALSADLRSGLLTGARLVFDRQLQVAAAEINRTGGRYTQLHKVVATSCRVCENNLVPLWEIRASRIVHDQKERQLYFDGAQLRVMGVPVFYAPRLRLPDPTLKRGTGFLIPDLRSTSQLGTGVKLPYFIRIGDHRDLTLTPYISTSTTTLEYRYRQAFRAGDVEINGAVSDDDLGPAAGLRGYLSADGRFDLPRGYRLAFDGEYVSDEAYMLDYGISGKDRLDSSVSLTRTGRDAHFDAALIHYKSLRASENSREIPSIIATVTRHTRFEPALVGGSADLVLDALGVYRRSSVLGDQGRDVVRMSATLDWRRDWRLGNGMTAGLLSGGRLDYYGTRQRAPSEENGLFATGTIGADLRWPLARTQANGVRHLIEPVAQVLWTSEDSLNVANEDSTLPEFDEGNLFAFSRFPGADRTERGLRANLGASWTRIDPAGWSLSLTMGRIIRAGGSTPFTAGSGLNGASSDWLAALQLDLAGNLTLASRSLFGDDFDLTRSESRLSWQGERLSLATTYIRMDPAPAQNRPEVSEWTFTSGLDFGRGWHGRADWRYDLVADRAARAGIGLEYRTECVRVALSLSRRFTSSTSVRPTTDFSLTVSLTGFGSGGGNGQGHTRRCQG